MKLRFIFSLLVGAALSASAQGYQDGVDNYNANRPDIAKVILENTINDPSTDKAVAYYYLGQIAFDSKDVAGAKSYFDKGAQANATYPYNFIGQGMVALAQGDKKGAETIFDTQLKANKKNDEVMAAIARAYWKVDPVKYEKDIEKQLAKAMKETKNQSPAVAMLRGDMLASENPGDAAGQYELAIMQDEEKGNVNREAYVKYAHVYDRHNRPLVIERLEKLNELEPNSGLAQRELAEQYYENQQFGRAWKQYERYIQNPNHFQRDEQRYSGMLYSAKEYQQSIDWANKVLAKDPTAYQMYRMLMLNYEALEQDSMAVEEGKKLFAYPNAEVVPNDYLVMGNLLMDLKKYDEALPYIEKYVEITPDQPKNLTTLSTAYRNAGQEQKAIETMLKYLDSGEASATDYYTMAQTYWQKARKLLPTDPQRKADCDEGLKYINMAIERAPGNIALQNMKIYILVTANGDVPNAEVVQNCKELFKLIGDDPANMTKYQGYLAASYYYCAAYYTTQKENAEARTYWEKYLQLRPNDQAAKKVLESL